MVIGAVVVWMVLSWWVVPIMRFVKIGELWKSWVKQGNEMFQLLTYSREKIDKTSVESQCYRFPSENVYRRKNNVAMGLRFVDEKSGSISIEHGLATYYPAHPSSHSLIE